jgi:hypothetical protein
MGSFRLVAADQIIPALIAEIRSVKKMNSMRQSIVGSNSQACSLVRNPLTRMSHSFDAGTVRETSPAEYKGLITQKVPRHYPPGDI